MSEAGSAASGTFKELEQSGWNAKASAYDDYAGKVTADAMAPLLDAAGVEAGMRVLDVACGPGYGAAGAAARGAVAVGVDFAPAMVAEATRRFPGIEFREGDGEALDFPDGSFDAIICPFGLLHMPNPEKAVAEAYRVLRPGGRYAFTVWSTPDKHDFFAVILGAIQAHGTLDAPLPPAPPIFRFSDPTECRTILTASGFAAVEVREIPLMWRAHSAEEALEMTYRSTVRTAMLLGAQAPEARENIHRAIVEGAARFRQGDTLQMAWPAVLAAATKP